MSLSLPIVAGLSLPTVANVAVPPAGWQVLVDADCTGGPGSTLNAGDTVTLGGQVWRVSRSAAGVSWLYGATGLQPVRATTGQLCISVALASILGRSWTPNDQILVAATMAAPLPAAGGTNQLHVGIWREQSTTTGTFEAALGGRLSASGSIRARSVTLAAAGTVLQNADIAYSPGTTELLACQANANAWGWLLSNGSLPADGTNAPRAGGAATVAGAGGIAAAAYDRVGLHAFLDNGVGAWGTITRVRIYAYNRGT